MCDLIINSPVSNQLHILLRFTIHLLEKLHHHRLKHTHVTHTSLFSLTLSHCDNINICRSVFVCDLIFSSTRADGVHACCRRSAKQIPVSMTRQHSLKTHDKHIHHEKLKRSEVTDFRSVFKSTWNSPERPPLKPHGSGSSFIIMHG